MVDINDYKEYKYHIRPNQSIWFCNARKSSRCGYERLDLEDPRVLEFVGSTLHRLLKTSDIAGRMFTIDLVLHDANLVFIRLKIRVLSERWNEEVSMKMIRLYDQANVFKGIGNGHEYDGLWKERSLELQELCKEIRAEFRKEHGHDMISCFIHY